MRTTILILAVVGTACTLGLHGEEPPEPPVDRAANSADGKTTSPKKLNFDFKDTPAREALEFLLSFSRKDVIYEPGLDVGKSINFKATDIAIEEALNRVAEMLDVRLFFIDEAYYVSKKEPAKIVIPPFVPKALSKDQEALLTRAIRDLASEEHARRESATKQIEDLGAAAYPAVQAALKETTDPESQTRLTRLSSLLFRKTEEGCSKALDRTLSFCACDIPLEAVLEFLSSLASVQFEKEPDFKFTLGLIRVTDMKMRSFVCWVARLSNAEIEATERGYRFVRRKEAQH